MKQGTNDPTTPHGVHHAHDLDTGRYPQRGSPT